MGSVVGSLSSSLNGRAIKALPPPLPPPELNGCSNKIKKRSRKYAIWDYLTPISLNLTEFQCICKLDLGKVLWNGLSQNIWTLPFGSELPPVPEMLSKIQSDLSPLGYSVFQMVLETHNVSLFRKIFEVLETLIFCCKKIVRSIESSEDSAKESSIKG